MVLSSIAVLLCVLQYIYPWTDECMYSYSYTPRVFVVDKKYDYLITKRNSLMTTTPENIQKRVLLLMSPATYRAGAFLSAARSLHLEVVVGIDLPETLADYWHVPLG